MKTLLLVKKKEDAKNKEVIELFGLSRSGKSTLLESLQKKGKPVLKTKHGFSLKKLFSAVKFMLKNPIKFLYLSHKLNTNWAKSNINLFNYIRFFILRNSYFLAVLAKYGLLPKKSLIYVEECITQLLLMIFHKKSNEKEIKKLIDLLPLPNKILLIESSSKARYKRISKTRFPGQQINKAYAEAWMKNTEHNYKIIRKILLENYNATKFK